MALPPAGDPRGSRLWFLRETVEPVTKVGAVVAALTYVAGFVVVNLHHGQFGIVELSLLKARVVAAGVLFGVLTLIPVMFLTRIHGLLAPRPTSALPNGTNDDGPIGTLIRRLELYPQCVALALPFIMLFEQGGSEKTGTPWGTGLVFISCSLLATFSRRLANIRTRPRVHLAVVGVGVLGVVWMLARGFTIYSRGFFATSVWFYGCALVALGLRGMWLQREELRTVDWEQMVGTALVALVLFSETIYGNVRARFGGGAPVPLSLYLSSDAPPLFGSAPAELWLVEETDQGFYVLRSRVAKAVVFVPRGLVRAAEFRELDGESVKSQPPQVSEPSKSPKKMFPVWP
jgi:hypothetical protein